MPYWLCANCGYYVQGPQPPDQCPSCDRLSTFSDITCSLPECEDESNINPKAVGASLGNLMTVTQEKLTVTRRTFESVHVAELFDGMTAEQSDKVKNLGRLESYEQNSVICKEGAESRKLYIVEKGQVAIQSELGKGLTIPITLVSEGQVFGWSSLVPPYQLTATATAATRIQILSIERRPLLLMMKNDAATGLIIMQNIARIIASRLRNLELAMIGLVRTK